MALRTPFLCGVAVLAFTNPVSSGLSLSSLSNRVDSSEALSTDGLFPGNNVSIPADIKSCPSEFYMHRPTFACYRIMKEVKSWYEAREECHTQGADLIWYENPVEYRHTVIKLLTSLNESKDYNNAGYWSGANDITGRPLVWGDTDMPVMSSFFSNSQSPSTFYRHGRQSSSSTENAQKHCVFMKYQRSTMRMTQELSECDGGRLYICKCKTRGKGQCVSPSKLD
ncbi:uncharacterized protein LOC135463345 [Liolophura sinensis]|uniref:uncharacterized protein LOC135463345 n=1 Tax=Liolophura sinensis TaxID=3198878 RepID=UPI0031581195